MELLPKLVAAADMCEAGEEVNLDELAFLMRYAADELRDHPTLSEEHERMLKRLRKRVLARCDLLDRGEKDRALANDGALEELERLDDEMDHEVARRFRPNQVDLPEIQGRRGSRFEAGRFKSGR